MTCEQKTVEEYLPNRRKIAGIPSKEPSKTVEKHQERREKNHRAFEPPKTVEKYLFAEILSLFSQNEAHFGFAWEAVARLERQNRRKTSIRLLFLGPLSSFAEQNFQKP